MRQHKQFQGSLFVAALAVAVPLFGCGGGSGSVLTPGSGTEPGGCGSGGSVLGAVVRRQFGNSRPVSGAVVVFIRDQSMERRQFVTDQQGGFEIISSSAIIGKIQVLQSTPRFSEQRPYDNSVPSNPPLIGTYHVAAETNVRTVDCGSQTVTLQIP